MIKRIYIENYKSIKKLGVGLGKLNLFFGMNGMGKSSTIQTLLLCRQSYWKSGKLSVDNLYTNGELTALGTVGEVFSMHADTDELVIDLTFDSCQYDLRYRFDSMYNNASILMGINPPELVDETLSLFGDGFTYIAANHIDPLRKYNYSGWDDNGINKFGCHGEYSVPYLAMNGYKITVPDEMCRSEGRTHMLIDQITAWMDKISPGVRLNTELLPSDQEARLNISYEEDKMVSAAYSPVNVGFGIPYVLPIILALLSAKKGDLVLIENPESHLHPRGQTAIAELMARASKSGVQVICESHSDHILNGVRVAIKEKTIGNEDVAVVYYSKDAEQNTEITQIDIDSNGNLDKYPRGLLDEWGDSMSKLL